MSKSDKLIQKLKNRTIKASEARTLLKQSGWKIKNQVGSHEQWVSGNKRLTIATHTKEIKPYLMKQIEEALEV